MSQSRLLYVVPQLTVGGLERQLAYLLGALDRDRYRPSVAVWNFGESDRFVKLLRRLGVPIIGLSSGPAWTKVLALRRLVGELRAEVVHSYSFYTNVAAALACLGRRSLAVGSIRNNYLYDRARAGWAIGRLSSRWPQHQICNNHAAVDNVERARGAFTPRRLIVVPNGLDLEAFPPVPIPRGGRLVVVGVGSLTTKKRWDRLFEPATAWKRDGIDVVVRIVGGGPLRAELEEQSSHMGLSGSVEFLGDVVDVAGQLGRGSFVIHVAEDEGCPNSVMEAMAVGRAVVATDAGDAALLVDDGITGFVVPQDSAELLDRRVRQLVASADLRESMGRAARQKAERDFGLDRLLEHTLAAYEAVGWRRDQDEPATL